MRAAGAFPRCANDRAHLVRAGHSVAGWLTFHLHQRLGGAACGCRVLHLLLLGESHHDAGRMAALPSASTNEAPQFEKGQQEARWRFVFTR